MNEKLYWTLAALATAAMIYGRQDRRRVPGDQPAALGEVLREGGEAQDRQLRLHGRAQVPAGRHERGRRRTVGGEPQPRERRRRRSERAAPGRGGGSRDRHD